MEARLGLLQLLLLLPLMSRLGLLYFRVHADLESGLRVWSLLLIIIKSDVRKSTGLKNMSGKVLFGPVNFEKI